MKRETLFFLRQRKGSNKSESIQRETHRETVGAPPPLWVFVKENRSIQLAIQDFVEDKQKGNAS